jgi:hypothetical protein
LQTHIAAAGRTTTRITSQRRYKHGERANGSNQLQTSWAQAEVENKHFGSPVLVGLISRAISQEPM